VAVGKAMKDKHGTMFACCPRQRRRAPRAAEGGPAQASYMGIGVYFAQEGVFEFAPRTGARSRCA